MDAVLEEYFGSENGGAEKAKRISSFIYSGEYTILQLMEGMQTQLTNEDSEKRLKALELIAKVLSYVQEDCLTSNQSQALTEYMCRRLEDHFSIHPPTLNALLSLSTRLDLGSSAAEAIARTIFKEVHVQSYMQSERYAVYEILSNLTYTYSVELQKLGNDFVYGVITAVDGEQDPRNLLKVFDLMHSVIRHGFDVTKFAEEYFDVVGCYFPIDFEPPSNLSGSKAVVTNEQLVKGLRKVLTSSQVFAPYLFPLMIEKIESDVHSAKLDALETLRESMKVFSNVSLSPYLKSIWMCVHKEAVEGVSKDTEDLSMELIKDIIAVLSKSSRSHDEMVLEKFIQNILQTCLPCITKNLQEKKVWSSGKLLVAAAEASSHACAKVVGALLPVLVKLLDNKQAMIAEKRLAMELIVCCLKATSLHKFENNDTNPVFEMKQSIVEIFCSSTSSKEFLHLRTVALAGIAALCSLGMLMTPDDQSTITCVLVYAMQHETDEMIYKDLLITLGFLSSKWPDVALLQILPVLKDALRSQVSRFNKSATKRYLDALCALSTNFEVSTVVCGFMIENICMDNIDEKAATSIICYLDAISAVVRQNSGDNECLEYFCNTLFLPLIANCVKLSLATTLPEQCCMPCSELETSPEECITWPIMEKVSEIARIIAQRLITKDRVDWICDMLVFLFIDRNLSKIDVFPTAPMSFDPFHNTMIPLQTRLVTLLTSTFPVFVNPAKDHRILDLMKNLLCLCLDTTDRQSYVSASKCLAGLLNKTPNEEILSLIFEEVSRRICDGSLTTDDRTPLLCLVVWVTKALVIRCHPHTMKYCKVLFDLFGHERLGKMAADSFDILFRSPEDILNEECHACIRLMHKQWFFQLVLPLLKEGFLSITNQQKHDMAVDVVEEDCYQHKKANYLTALSHLLHHLPKQVLNQHLQSLLPLLVKSLSSNEAPLLVSVLSTIHNLMQDAKSSLVPHVNMLVDRFAQLASFKGNLHVRIQSLKCIGVMTLLPTDVVLPHKKRVIRELTTVLDDRKRLVRKEAVKARTQWCLLGDI